MDVENNIIFVIENIITVVRDEMMKARETINSWEVIKKTERVHQR